MIAEMQNEQQRFIDNNICVRFIGDKNKLSSHMHNACTALEKATEHGTALQVNILVPVYCDLTWIGKHLYLYFCFIFLCFKS